MCVYLEFYTIYFRIKFFFSWEKGNGFVDLKHIYYIDESFEG